jgi:putative peptidoglycan lipid II flippase
MTVQTLITKTQNTILSAALIISISTGLSAVLGVIKNRLLARQFGVSDELAVFYTADYIPSLLYSVLIVGAISTIFIPVFTGLLNRDHKAAFRTASTIINATIVSFLIVGSLIFLFSSPIFKLVSLNQFSPGNTLLGSQLIKIMILSQMLLVCGSLATSVLQSFKYFLIPALAPIVYNLGMVLGIVFLSPSLGIYGPAIGLLAGATFHFAIQIPLLKKTGFRLHLSLNLKDENFKKMLTLIPPRVTSVLIANLIQTVNNSFAILISSSSVIALKFANQLQGFPINLFGFSIAAASLPTLSAEGEEKNLDNFKKTFLTSLHQMMFLVVPLSMILFILRVPVVRIVYGVSNFPWEATVETASVLAIFSFSIFAQSANYLITRSFYALKDTVTPVLVAVGTSVVNIALSTLLIVVLKYNVWAVAFSYSLTSIFDTLILLYLLDKKIGTLDTKALFMPFLKISTSAILMALTLYVPVKLLDQVIFDTTRTVNLLILTLIAGTCGILTYLIFTKILKVEEINLLYRIVGKLKLSKKEVSIEIPGYSEKPAE